MSEALIILLIFAAGLFLGICFFCGLWWTISRGLTSKRPVLLFFGSLLVRISMLLAGLYIVSEGSLERLLICLLGFIIARFIVTRLIGTSTVCLIAPVKEVYHAPES